MDKFKINKKLFHIVNSKYYNILIDLLISFCIIFQDIYKMKLFGTPFYKYIILLILLLTTIKLILTRKTIKVSKYVSIILIIIYLYTYIVGYKYKNVIIIPSIFFLIESSTFLLYIQTFKSKEELRKRIFNIIYLSSLILAFFGIVQFISYKLNIDFIYKNITQFTFYLDEGRITSIYSEPAHLCAILGGGIFINMYYLTFNYNIKYCFYMILLLVSGLLTSSIITYMSIFGFILLYIIYFLINRNSIELKNKKKLILTILLTFGTCIIYVGLFNNNNIYSQIINKIQSLYNKNYGNTSNDLNSIETTNDIYNLEKNNDIKEEKPIENNGNNKNEIKEEKPIENNDNNIKEEITLNNTENYIQEQSNNQSGFAIKSNYNIAIEKLKDGYYFGTGMFSHINYYDKYMSRIYPKGYIRINYADACSMFLRIFSEFGIIGLIIYCFMLLKLLIKGFIKKDLFLLFILMLFVTQSIRLGEYNWILNCFCFTYLITNTSVYSKSIISINKKGNAHE